MWFERANNENLLHQICHTEDFRKRKELLARVTEAGKKKKEKKKKEKKKEEAKIFFAIIFFSFDTIDTETLSCITRSCKFAWYHTRI